jgi:hypothetical protein
VVENVSGGRAGQLPQAPEHPENIAFYQKAV